MVFSLLRGSIGPTLGAPNTAGGGAAPVITSPAFLVDGTVGTIYPTTTFTATGSPTITWSVTAGTLPAGMAFSSAGVLSGTPTVTASGSITFRATNAFGFADRALTLTVNAAGDGIAPLITTTNAPASGTVGVSYTSTLTIDAGSSPVTWSLAAGSLPTGLSVSNSGVISGTPAIATNKPAVFRASNSYGSSEVVFFLNITNAAGSIAPTITTESLLPGAWNNSVQSGGAYSYQLQASGSTPITWSLVSGTLPSGLSLNSSGLISGTPTSNSAATIVVQATNSHGNNQKTLTFPASFVPANSGAYCTSGTFPANWIWTSPTRTAQANPATSGTKRIDQIRGGAVIATYTTLGSTGGTSSGDIYLNPALDVSVGAFHRTPYTNMMDGDIFEVYPAVYDQDSDQPYIGASYKNYADFLSGTKYIPRNITIRGKTIGGVRPLITCAAGVGASYNNLNNALVYFDECENVVFENFDIQCGSATYIGKSGLYVNSAKNLTVRNVRISGFKARGANGIKGTGNASGTLRLDNVELINNGGNSGPEHNAYIDASTVDSNYTVYVTNSYSTGTFYGHEFKSRAQNNILEGNYFVCARADATNPQTDAYVVDIPDGGNLVMRNNIIAKDYSGDNSNGAAIEFAGEANTRTNQSIIIEHNTFVAWNKFYDNASHPIWPLFLQYPQKLPAMTGFTPTNVSINNNLFIGYCLGGNYIFDYRGSNFVEAQFTDVSTSFSPITPTISSNTGIIGSSIYSHTSAVPGVRTTAAIGARD